MSAKRRGLTTAASIWAASANGVLLGVGFYAASLLLALLCMASMSLPHRREARLPGRSTLEVRVTFGVAGPPSFDDLAVQAEARGYRVRGDSLRITFSKRQPVWRFCGLRWTAPAQRRRHYSRTKWPCLTAWRASASCQSELEVRGIASPVIAPL